MWAHRLQCDTAQHVQAHKKNLSTKTGNEAPSLTPMWVRVRMTVAHIGCPPMCRAYRLPTRPVTGGNRIVKSFSTITWTEAHTLSMIDFSLAEILPPTILANHCWSKNIFVKEVPVIAHSKGHPDPNMKMDVNFHFFAPYPILHCEYSSDDKRNHLSDRVEFHIAPCSREFCSPCLTS